MVMSMQQKSATARREQRIKRSALGGGVWVAWALAVRPEWTAVLLLLSPFVLLPLGLHLAASDDTGPEAPTLRPLAQLAPAVATTAAMSFVPEPGLLAALLSVPWLAFTVTVALAGVGRLLSRPTIVDPGIGADAGLAFVAIGGAWLTISRAGLNPLGFSDAIVQLTAVHFHYAGFALPIVAGFTASLLNRSALIPLAVIVGVPLTAIGITAGGWLEWFAATAMALAGIATAALLLRLSTHERGPARWLIGTAGVALMAGMSLALGWSWSIRFGWHFLGLESMAATHGSLNALGFGLLGLLGLNLVGSNVSLDTGATNLHLGRPSAESLQRLAERAANRATTNVAGLLNRPTPARFERKTWQRHVDHGDFAAAADAIRHWRGHDAAGIKRSPALPKIADGETLALAIPVGPISISATCRIVEVIDEPDRYGFTYSTLPHHPADGEESFIVTRDKDGSVDVTVTAVWRPATVANHLFPPLTRFLQNRAINRYLDGIATVTEQIAPMAATS
jgi:uncharacterized protein (UPF0548 family)